MGVVSVGWGRRGQCVVGVVCVQWAWSVCVSVCPACQEEFTNIEVEYCCMPGWKSSTEHCRQFSELPEQAQAYVRKVEEQTGVPG